MIFYYCMSDLMVSYDFEEKSDLLLSRSKSKRI